MYSSASFAVGSIHKGDERFSDISRGRQCTFMSLSALLCAQSLPMSLWTTEVIDDILFDGDYMYKNSFENCLIPDTETLSLDYLPGRA